VTENVREKELMCECGKERESFGESGGRSESERERHTHTPEGTREPC